MIKESFNQKYSVSCDAAEPQRNKEIKQINRLLLIFQKTFGQDTEMIILPRKQRDIKKKKQLKKIPYLSSLFANRSLAARNAPLIKGLSFSSDIK